MNKNDLLVKLFATLRANFGFIPDGLLLGVIPIFAYYAAYKYEVSFLRMFCVDPEIVRVDLLQVLASIPVVFGANVMTIVRGVLLMLLAILASALFAIRPLIVIMAIVAVVLFWLDCDHAETKIYLIRSGIAFLVCGLCHLGFTWLQEVSARYGLASTIWQAMGSVASPMGHVTIFLCGVFFLLVCMSSITVGANHAAWMMAKDGRNYFFDESDQGMVLVRDYGDLLIFSEIDLRAMKPTGRIVIKKVGDNTIVKLQRRYLLLTLPE